MPKEARVTHIVPRLAQSSLVSVKVLCNAGCNVAYDGKKYNVTYNNRVIWEGIREPST